MEDEGNQTTLLKWERDPASGGEQTPASGGKWFINDGNICMLAELVWWAHSRMTMYDLYRMWISLPVSLLGAGTARARRSRPTLCAMQSF